MTSSGSRLGLGADASGIGQTAGGWTPIARLTDLPIDRGVAAIVDGRTVAVFRLADDQLFAIDHVDPTTGVAVLARGLVGSVGGAPVVVSPLHKQRYDLRSGACVDDPAVRIATWGATVIDGVVCVRSND